MKQTTLRFLLLLSIFLPSCRDRDAESKESEAEKSDNIFFSRGPESPSKLTSNRLANESSNFLRTHADSAINWQPWSSDILDLAERSQRLILVLVGSTYYSQSYQFADLLETQFKDQINVNYVPVLADIEVDPALSLAANYLALERGESIAFPFALWLSHEGNPVAWMSVSTTKEAEMLSEFRRASNTVQAILNDSQRYIVENSRFDNKGRLKRITSLWNLTEQEEGPQPKQGELFLRAQGLADLYDPTTSTFDNTGGIPPANLITTLSRISQHPACPPRLRKNAKRATQAVNQHLIQSAIRDPLDGQFYIRRGSNSFAIPILSKHVRTQAEMLSALVSSASNTISDYAIEQLITSFLNNRFESLSINRDEVIDEVYFWKKETLSELLSPQELEVATAAFGLHNLGNIPGNDDPQRNFFRRNTLGLVKFGPQLAAELNLPSSEAEKLLTSLSTKLAIHQDTVVEANNGRNEETLVTVSNQAYLLTGLVRAQATKPNTASNQLLENIGNQILNDYLTEDQKLLRILQDGKRESLFAQAQDYVVVLEALLEWYRLTWNEEILFHIKGLTNTFLDHFIDENGYPFEVNPAQYPLSFPIYNSTMIFGASTWGVCYHVLQRLSQLGYEHERLQTTLTAIILPLETGLKKTPVLHTDYLLAATNNVEGYLLVLSKSQANNRSLRQEFMNPAFDSIQTIVENETFTNLPSLQNSAAILLQKGKVVSRFQNTSGIPSALRQELAR